MRTTLTLDDDVAERLAEVARQTRQPFKAVVNSALRRGLGEFAPREPAFQLRAHAGNLRPDINDGRLNEMAWELDVQPGAER